MYVPDMFAVESADEVVRIVETNPLAAIVGMGTDGLTATHAPMLPHIVDGAVSSLHCHFARANPHWKDLDGDVLAIFQGLDSYITPGWYMTKQETGKVVPTWNYESVHIYGAAKVTEDADWLLAHVSALTDRFEAGRDAPWATSDAPDGFMNVMIRGIVGVEITVTRVEAKIKASQNRPDADRRGVVEGLGAEKDLDAQRMAALVAGYAGFEK